MLAQNIYKCLWHLLLLLVSLYEVCRWLHFRVIAFALWSYDLCQTQEKRQQNEYEFLRQCKKRLTKIPKHLNLIIGPEAKHVNEDLLSRLFAHALYMNIECVSYFDTRLESSENSLGLKQVPLNKIKCPQHLKCKSSDDRHAVWYNEDVVESSVLTNGKKQMNGVTNGKVANGQVSSSSSLENHHSLRIHEILSSDNRPLIAQVCRNLYRQRHAPEIQKLLKTRSLLTNHLDQELKQHLRNLTEPDLSIVFHDNICTFGLMPWHARFTEFHCHDPVRRFDVEAFASILYKYSRCEQRWGK